MTGYEILRRRPKQGADTLLIHVADTGSAATSYTDGEAAEAGERYVYRVKALRGGENTRQSNYVNVELPDDFTPPQQSDPADLAPANLTAERADGDGVVLAWDAPAEDAESVTGYAVLRARGEAELTVLVADTGDAETTYTDAGATEAGATYAYRVRPCGTTRPS